MKTKPLTQPMHAMLAQFAAGFRAWSILSGRRGEVAVLNGLILRGLVRFEPEVPGGNVGEYRITEAGRAEAWKALTGMVPA